MLPYNRLFFMLSICFFTMIISCSDKTKENEKLINAHIESARQLIAQNKIQTAIIEYRNAVNLAPKNKEALFELAEAYVLNRQVNNAIRYYNLSAKADPENILPLLRLAQIYIQTNQLLEARNHISTVLAISPVSVEAYHLLSGVQLMERDIESAIETLNKAIPLDDKNTKTYISLANLYLKSSSQDKAEDAYQKAIKSDSASREAYRGLTQLYINQKKWDRAENLLKEVAETPGIKIEKYTDLAKFYQGRKQFSMAEEYLNKAVNEDTGRIEPLINLSEFYTRMNKKDSAISTMKKALAIQPDSPLILSGLAQIYLHFNMIEDAQEVITKALVLNSDNTDVLFQQGRILMFKNNYSEALNIFDEVIAFDQLNAKAYYYRALCIQQRGATDRPEQKIFRAAAGLLDDPEEFEKDQIKGNLLAAITISPNLLDARVKLLEIYLLEKDLKNAREQMKEIFKQAPPNTQTMTLLSGLRLLEGNEKAAEQILLSIIKNKPNYIPAYIRLGILYGSTGNPDKAQTYFQKAFDMNPNQLGIVRMMVNLYLGLKEQSKALDLVNTLEKKFDEEKAPFFNNLKGEIYLSDQKPDTAFKFFKQAADKAPNYIPPQMQMARILTIQNTPQKALELYKKVEDINPQYVPALIAASFIYDAQRNLDEAEKYYRKVLERIPDHIDAANNLAFILSEKKGGTDEALELASIAREKAPKNAAVLDTMGWIYYQKGNYLNALSELEESLKLNPDSALACFHYGMALYRNQEFEKARQYFRKALEIDPGFKDASTAKEMLN